MERLNAFITSNKPALSRFYDQIVEHPDQGKLTNLAVQVPPPPTQPLLRLTPLARLTRWL
jgi:hypothetical protein